MIQATTWWINPNTRTVTSNFKNAIIKDKDAFEEAGMQQHLLRPVEDWIQVRKKPIKFADKPSLNRLENSVNIAPGQRIDTNDGHTLTITQWGIDRSSGRNHNPYDQKACQKANYLAGALDTLLRNASGNVRMYMAGRTTAELVEWSESVSEVMKYLGIDTSRDFTVNGMKYSKNEKGYWESQADSEAKKAYEQLSANNRTYQFADEKTKKQIAYISNYYLQTVPESARAAWRETLEETGVNPFADGFSSTLKQLSVEQDFATGGNDNILGDTIESCLAAIDKILERIENPLETVEGGTAAGQKEAEERAVYRQQEKAFYTVLASKIKSLQ